MKKIITVLVLLGLLVGSVFAAPKMYYTEKIVKVNTYTVKSITSQLDGTEEWLDADFDYFSDRVRNFSEIRGANQELLIHNREYWIWAFEFGDYLVCKVFTIKDLEKN